VGRKLGTGQRGNDGDDPWECREKVVNEIIRSGSAGNPSAFDARFIAHIDRLRTQTPEDLDRLTIWVPEDTVQLRLVQGGTEQTIEAGSGGQRTAGMLALLMCTTNSPLVIDQPEDDLYTKLITELICRS
jgi:hypothetical protein